MENDLSFSLDEDEDEAIVTEDVNLSPIVTSNDDMSFTIDEDDTEEEEEETIDMGSFETSTPVVQTETQEALTPSTSESLPEIATELDSRISSKYSMLEDGLVDKAMARLEDSSASWERYDAMVEVARKEDEVTGGQRALMVPKPQSERFTQQSIEAMENNKKELRDNVQEMLNDPNPIRAEAVDKLLDTGMSLEQINFIVRGADFAPVTGAVLGVTDIPENIREARALWGEGRYGSAASLVGISLAEIGFAAVGTKAVVAPVLSKVKKSMKVTKTMEQIKTADATAVAAKREVAARVAKENSELGQQLINEFELNTGKTISTTSDKGVKTLDGQLARTAGLEIAQDVSNLQDARAVAFMKDPTKAKEEFKDTAKASLSEEVVVQDLTEDIEKIVNPLLVPEKFDAIVAIASDFQKANPKAFPKDKSVIDSLFDYTVSDDLSGSEELASMLSKYGLTFDDYVLTVVGSGSEAGKIMNKLSQIRRAGSLESLTRKKNLAKDISQNKLLQAWRRIENIRRGGMVSMVKTASRNLTSATIRAPLEALENVFDTTLYNMSDEWAARKDIGSLRAFVNASSKGITSTISPKNWKDSTKALQRTYLNPILAKDITEFILKRPEFDEQYTSMFDLVNEYQTNIGRGKSTTKVGKVVDGTLSALEDGVALLNTPNRIQEFIIRRGAFMGEMERLVSREYGKDLMTLLKEGKLQDLIGNSNTVRPKGARPFEEIIEDSTRRALDVTYAKAPDVPIFNDISNFLTRTGLTAVTTPFPRFMFNSLELMGQYSAGAFNPAIKRAFGNKKGPLDAKDRQNISRNISGLVGITAAYQYRNSEDAPADYKLINTDEGTVMDTTSQYPLRQALWIAEAIKRLSPDAQKYIPLARGVTGLSEILGSEKREGDGTFNSWFDIKDAQEVFLGTAARTGAGNVYVEELSKILAGGEDVTKTERFQRTAARQAADYLRTWAIPLTQVVELQRVTGDRPAAYSDAATDEQTLGISFSEQLRLELERTGRQTGLSNIFDPSEEAKMPTRVSIFSDAKERKGLAASIAGGITQFTRNSADAEYLENLGYSEFELSSKERIPSIRRTENEFFLEALPNIVAELKALETGWRKEYMKAKPNSAIKKSKTLQQYIITEAKSELDRQRQYYKDQDKDFKTMNTDDLLLNNRKFRKLRPNTRKLTIQRFIKEEDRNPNFSDIDDMDWLLTEGSFIQKK
tara:strand:+ start:1143 stop:4769 length:3627 start_codon:yes stop_codon:yes gene_type:complete